MANFASGYSEGVVRTGYHGVQSHVTGHMLSGSSTTVAPHQDPDEAPG